MLAQVVLTPAESRKLIAVAVAKPDVVERDMMGPSSSTYFIVEPITGQRPQTN